MLHYILFVSIVNIFVNNHKYENFHSKEYKKITFSIVQLLDISLYNYEKNENGKTNSLITFAETK